MDVEMIQSVLNEKEKNRENMNIISNQLRSTHIHENAKTKTDGMISEFTDAAAIEFDRKLNVTPKSVSDRFQALQRATFKTESTHLT